MAKVNIAIVTGVAAVYPVGQDGESKTLKAGQTIDLTVPGGPHATPKGKTLHLPEKVEEDLDAPAVGVATGEPFGERDGTVRVTAKTGAVIVRVYEGSQFRENPLANGESLDVAITESNRITLAVYAAEAEPK